MKFGGCEEMEMRFLVKKLNRRIVKWSIYRIVK